MGVAIHSRNSSIEYVRVEKVKRFELGNLYKISSHWESKALYQRQLSSD